MPKGMVERSGGRTAASDLRDMLRELEIGAGNLEGKGEGVLDVLRLRGEVQEEMERLLEQGLNLKSEQTRLETVDGVITRHAEIIEKELRKVGGLASAREQEQPSEDQEWWFVDIPYYEARKRRKRTTWISLVVILVVVAVGAYVSNLLWGPNTKAEKARASFVSAQQYVARQDWDAAIEEFQRTLRIDKDRGEAYVYLGVLYEVTNQDAEAREAFTKAQNALRNRRSYLQTLAMAYEEAEELQSALEQLDELIALQSTHAEAHLQRAEIYAELGDAESAARDFARAADLAEDQNLEKVFNQAKLRLNIMMKTLTPAE